MSAHKSLFGVDSNADLRANSGGLCEDIVESNVMEEEDSEGSEVYDSTSNNHANKLDAFFHI